MKRKLFRCFSSLLVVILLLPLFSSTALAANRTIIQSSGASMPDIVLVGERYTLGVTGSGTVKFYSSDTKIATVGETKGVLRLKASGTVIITARDAQGNYVLAAQPDSVAAEILDPAEVISVNIAWDDMCFTYTAPGKGTWNPDTHTYENASEGG